MDSVVHFEIPAKDTSRSQEFYSNVFGWKVNNMPEMSYAVLHTVEVDENNMPMKPGAINGGMMTEEDNGGPNPVLVIDVSDIDEYVEKIKEAGGEIIMEKTQVGDMGYYVRFKDTEGVVMGIWETIKQ